MDEKLIRMFQFRFFPGLCALFLSISCSSVEQKGQLLQQEPRQVQHVKKANLAKTDRGKLVYLVSDSDILFDFGSARLKPGDLDVLEYLASELQFAPYRILVVGYTDYLGSENYNQQLSIKRAEAVKVFLLSKGIDPDKIQTQGRGESQPMTNDSCSDSMVWDDLIACLAPDRRVEIETLRIKAAE